MTARCIGRDMDEPKLTGNGLLFGGGIGMLCEETFTATMVSLYGIAMTILILWVLEKMLGVDELLSASLLFQQYIKQMHPPQSNERDISPALRRVHTEASASTETLTLHPSLAA